MAINLKVGEKIPLFLTLESKDTSRFVRVTLYDEAGVQVGAIVSVSHLADGNYFDDSRLMPSALSLVAVYDVFRDAGFTMPSNRDATVNERFDLDTTAGASGGTAGGSADVIAISDFDTSIAIVAID